MSQCLMFQGSADHVDSLWLFHTFPFLSKYKPGCWFDPKTWSKKLQINHLSIHINIQNTVGIWFDIYMMPIPWLVMVPANDSGWRKDCWSHRRRKEIAISVERDQNPGFLLLYMGEYACTLLHHDNIKPLQGSLWINEYHGGNGLSATGFVAVALLMFAGKSSENGGNILRNTRWVKDDQPST